MKSSSATSARATGPRRPTARSSDRRPSRISVDGFALDGPSDPPDPNRHAYRKDLADVALAGQVIASHYAEPVPRVLVRATPLRSQPGSDSAVICPLDCGDPFELLDDSLGWAWGYGGRDRRVGYVEADALDCA